MSSSARNNESGRAAVFAAIAVLAFFLAIPASMWLARPPSDLTQAERLGAEIGCTCGTCPHRPIATCGCGFADGMLARLDAEVAAGKSDDEIMAAFIADYGNGIKIKPESSGFDLMAWAAPIAFLLVGAVALAGVIAQWRAGSTADDEIATADASDAVAQRSAAAEGDSDRYLEIVERELDALDD